MQRRTRNKAKLTNPSELVVISKCLDLLKYTFTVTSNDKNIAKKYRLTVVKMIQDTVLTAYQYMIRANLIYPRNKKEFDRRMQYHQFTDEQLHILLSLAEVSTVIGNFHSPGYWSKLTWEVIRLNKAWAASDMKQFKDLPE
nr:MAG TPA: Avd-like protein [Caudoviricetes sp.]